MFNYTAASKIEDLREADIGARSRSRSPGHSHNVLDSAKSSCGGLILGPVSISKVRALVSETRLATARSRNFKFWQLSSGILSRLSRLTHYTIMIY